MKSKLKIAKGIAPWAAAFGILAYLFHRTDLDSFIQSLKYADLFLYLPLVILFIFIWFFLEGVNLKALFSHFGSALSYRDVLSMRGTTYLLMILNYSLGIGGIAFYLNKVKGMPLKRAASLVLFYNFSDIISIAFMASVACALTFESSELTERLLILSVSVFSGYLIAAIALKNLPARGFLKRVLNIEILRAFREAGIKQYVLIPLYRAVYFSTFVVFFYFAVQTFNMEIPISYLAAVIPIALFIAAIPITPSGLGTMQASMLYFFYPYSHEPNILAFSVVYSASILILRVPIGLYYLKTLSGVKLIDGKLCETTGGQG